ncbi:MULTISPECIES: hypothetical protein [unclassified Nocardiopsis]|uniref:hypothetical protein n=1 Tax=unclassified Nocardiopsis TaxID=2649073 RepID=UPI00135B5D69|nr:MULTISPECIES: hypothetical protein [unclassified Nocardiopsis]
MTTPHDLDRLERICAVTARYRDYQGLNLVPLGLLLMSLALLGGRGAESLFAALPVAVVLAFAAAIALCAFPDWRPRAHHLAVAALLAAVSLTPIGLWTQTGAHPLGFTSVASLLVVGGAAVCLAGVLDHLVLVRTLPSARPATNGTD